MRPGWSTPRTASIRGEARIALARVADRDGAAGGERHPGRPPCDTTHCQAFRGTVAPRPEDRAALGAPAPAWPVAAVLARRGRAVDGASAPPPRWRPRSARAPATSASSGGRVSFLAPGEDAGAGARFEERRSLPCELLRGPLKLPSCPARAVTLGDRLRFEGRGEGHGEGLDVEWARRSGLRAEEILERAYGAAGR